MKSKFEIFLDTDVFLSHLHGGNPGESSALLKCLSMFDCCFTSVVNASEIFSGCSDAGMIEKARHSFYGVGVLGIPYKYSLKIGEILSVIKKKN